MEDKSNGGAKIRSPVTRPTVLQDGPGYPIAPQRGF